MWIREWNAFGFADDTGTAEVQVEEGVQEGTIHAPIHVLSRPPDLILVRSLPHAHQGRYLVFPFFTNCFEDLLI